MQILNVGTIIFHLNMGPGNNKRLNKIFCQYKCRQYLLVKEQFLLYQCWFTACITSIIPQTYKKSCSWDSEADRQKNVCSSHDSTLPSLARPVHSIVPGEDTARVSFKLQLIVLTRLLSHHCLKR